MYIIHFFQVIRSILRLLPSAASVKAVVLDFEFAMSKAVRRVSPTVTARGCAFHWVQAVWKKCQKLGLQVFEVYISFNLRKVSMKQTTYHLPTNMSIRKTS